MGHAVGVSPEDLAQRANPFLSAIFGPAKNVVPPSGFRVYTKVWGGGDFSESVLFHNAG